MPILPLMTLAAAIGALYWFIRRHGAADQAAAPADPLGAANDPAPSLVAAVESVVSDTAGAVFGAGQAVLDQARVTVGKVFQLPDRAQPYMDTIDTAERAQGLPTGLLGRVLYQESRYRADIIDGTTRSSTGAAGIAQFMPGTAAEMGIDPLDPGQAIPAAAKYLRRLFDQLGTWPAAIAAYNWGPGNVKRKGLAAAPAETRAYVAQITADVPGLSEG